MKRRGIALFELIVAMSMMAFVLFGIISLFVAGVKSLEKSNVDVNLGQKNAQGLRRVAETLRSAYSIVITNSGKTITYTMPLKTGYADAITGEVEFVTPLRSDNVNRTFNIVNGELIDSVGNRKLVKGIRSTDPDLQSSQYNQAYSPFQLTTIGSLRAVSINLITAGATSGGERYVRLKTTAVIRNAR